MQKTIFREGVQNCFSMPPWKWKFTECRTPSYPKSRNHKLQVIIPAIQTGTLRILLNADLSSKSELQISLWKKKKNCIYNISDWVPSNQIVIWGTSKRCTENTSHLTYDYELPAIGFLSMCTQVPDDLERRHKKTQDLREIWSRLRLTKSNCGKVKSWRGWVPLPT